MVDDCSGDTNGVVSFSFAAGGIILRTRHHFVLGQLISITGAPNFTLGAISVWRGREAELIAKLVVAP